MLNLISNGTRTKNSREKRLSRSQLEVLLLGSQQRLFRSSMGWSPDLYTSREVVRVYSPATIRSLWQRGFLDSNFDDPRGVGSAKECGGVQNLDGAMHDHSAEVPKLLIWTSAAGKELLKAKGVALRLEGLERNSKDAKIRLSCMVEHQTERAVLIECDSGKAWLPRES